MSQNIIVVQKIVYGVPEEMFTYSSVDKAEEKFGELITDVDVNICDDDIESYLEEGYWEHPSLNLSVTITHSVLD